MSHTTPNSPNASEFFSINTEFNVVICRQCEHRVRKDNIFTHLTSTNHRVTRTVARYIANCVQQWEHIEDQPNISGWPTQIDKPIPGLTIYNDGLLCLKCSVYVCRNSKGIKNHWSDAHQWSPSTHEGRPKPSEIAGIQAEIDANRMHISCQRIFKHGAGSHFIHIRQSTTNPEPAIPPADTIKQLVQRVREFQAQQTRSRRTNIQAGELDEATP